jgi:hypothetical protein
VNGTEVKMACPSQFGDWDGPYSRKTIEPPASAVASERTALSDTDPPAGWRRLPWLEIFGDAFTTVDCSLVSLHLPVLSAKWASSLESKDAIHR